MRICSSLMWPLRHKWGWIGIDCEKMILQWPDKLCHGVLWMVLERRKGRPWETYSYSSWIVGICCYCRHVLIKLFTSTIKNVHLALVTITLIRSVNCLYSTICLRATAEEIKLHKHTSKAKKTKKKHTKNKVPRIRPCTWNNYKCQFELADCMYAPTTQVHIESTSAALPDDIIVMMMMMMMMMMKKKNRPHYKQ